jgi:hypothetical protein
VEIILFCENSQKPETQRNFDFENFQEGTSKTQHQGSFNFGKFQEPKTSTKSKNCPTLVLKNSKRVKERIPDKD